MTSRLPRNTGDPSFVTFTMAWVSHSLGHPGRLFDAPIFFPHHNTLAYSDPLLPLGALWGVGHWISGNWTVATGMVALAMVVANLAATYALAKRLTGRADAAALAALAFALSDFALAQWGHIQMQALGFLPLGFLLLFRLLERGRWSDGLLLGLVQGAMAMTTASIALAWAVAAVAAVAAHVIIRRFRLGREVWKALAIAALVSAALVVPAALPYTNLQRDPNFTRPLEPLASFRWRDLVSPTRTRQGPLAALQLPATRRGVEHEAFPGLTALALGTVGLGALVLTRRRRTGREHELVLVAIAGAVCLLTAMGPDILGPVSPYRLLHDDVPGFAGLRVATRFTIVTILAVALLAASGLAWLAARLPRPQLARTVGWAAVTVLLLELAMPVRWRHLDTDPATLAVYRELATRAPGPVAELPMASFVDGSTWSDVEAPRQVYSTLDWHPRVNGYSGFVTPDYYEKLTALNRFPEPCAIDEARAIGVRWIVVHTGVVDRIRQYDALETGRVMAGLPKDAVTRAGRSYLVDVTKLPSAPC
ncbi:MAG: hypothetical protein JWO37_3479 [Acidimicrobiales bacterium]|nr:hypothetical protein [Acidimicrobiales bacterium]